MDWSHALKSWQSVSDSRGLHRIFQIILWINGDNLLCCGSRLSLGKVRLECCLQVIDDNAATLQTGRLAADRRPTRQQKIDMDFSQSWMRRWKS